MQEAPIVTFELIMTSDEAAALARMLMRADLCDLRRLVVNGSEARVMRAACETLRRELVNAGFAPQSQ